MLNRSSSSAVVHSVHFYETDDALVRRLRAITESALTTGSSVLLIVTPSHREQLVRELSRRGIDARIYEREARLQIYNAQETLKRFFVGRMPDPERFFATVGRIVQDAKDAAIDGRRGLVAFGEMVSLLWQQGNEAGALALEELWNELLNRELFHLHCAYPRHLVEQDGKLPHELCAAHSHVIGGYAAA